MKKPILAAKKYHELRSAEAKYLPKGTGKAEFYDKKGLAIMRTDDSKAITKMLQELSDPRAQEAMVASYHPLKGGNFAYLELQKGTEVAGASVLLERNLLLFMVKAKVSSVAVGSIFGRDLGSIFGKDLGDVFGRDLGVDIAGRDLCGKS